MPYPSIISTISNPQASDRLNNPSHSSIHQAENTAITEIETFVGTLSSTVGTLVYDIRAAASNGGGHVQTANKGGTGQISFNKGDILVAQSSSVLTKLAISTDNLVLTADSSQAVGIKWANASSNVQSFLSTGVWQKPSTISQIFVQLWGAGGGGAGGSIAARAGGGGGGAYVEGYINPSLVSSSVIIGIGAGGLGVTGGGGGNAGGNTVFDTVSSLITAYGGGGGGGNGSGSSGGGGGGGIYGIGADGSPSGGGAGGPNGWVGASSIFSSGGGGSGSAAQNAIYAGGGGGDSSAGGKAQFGGGGGGGSSSSTLGIGGLSYFGGNGGNGSVLTNASMIAGKTPSGGGGAAYGNGATSGSGGGGKAIITAIA